MLLNAQELAKFYKCQRSTVSTWIKEGCPVAQESIKGKQVYLFDSLDVAKWREKRAMQNVVGNAEVLSKDEAQRRKLQAEAALAELDLAKKKGEVVDLHEISIDLQNKFAQLRSSLRKIPERTVLRVVGMTDEQAIKKILLAEIDSALEVLADE